MEFGLLGPLEVTNNGRTLRLGGSRQRALLALLLLRANEAVPLDQLVDGLWGDSPPKTAEQIVRVYARTSCPGTACRGNAIPGHGPGRGIGQQRAFPAHVAGDARPCTCAGRRRRGCDQRRRRRNSAGWADGVLPPACPGTARSRRSSVSCRGARGRSGARGGGVAPLQPQGRGFLRGGRSPARRADVLVG